MPHRIITSDLSPEEIYPDPLEKLPRCATSHRPTETVTRVPSPTKPPKADPKQTASSSVDPFPAKKPITKTNPGIPPT